MVIETIEVYGFASALKAMRLPFKGVKSSDSNIDTKSEESGFNIQGSYSVEIGAKDFKLLTTLIKRGDQHAKTVRGITASCSITAPRYWWQEMDTYRFGHERLSSESTMHSEAKGLSGEELQKVKGELKESHEQTRIDVFSYQTLRRIYYQRKNHRLPEWTQFCEWIETLPCQEFITVGVENGE